MIFPLVFLKQLNRDFTCCSENPSQNTTMPFHSAGCCGRNQIFPESRDGAVSQTENIPVSLGCDKSQQSTRTVNKTRIVVPCLRHFKEEYEKQTKHYKSNSIRTSKYNLWSFVPRNLFEQFHRYTILRKYSIGYNKEKQL